MTQPLAEIDFNEYMTIQSSWKTLPTMIEWLKTLRHSPNGQPHNINITIVLHSACIIEGFIYSLIEDTIGERIEYKKFEDRLELDFMQRLRNASWMSYQELFRIRFDSKMSEFTKNETWKAIINLFDLRNLLTHGKSITMDFKAENNYEPIFAGKFANIYSYLKEIKLIPEYLIDFKPHSIDIVSNDIVDYFNTQANLFINDLYRNLIMKKFKDYPIAEGYRIAFPNRLKRRPTAHKPNAGFRK